MSNHVLLVSNSVWNLVHFRRPILHSLLEKGYQVSVAAPEDNHVFELASLGINFFPVRIQRKGKNPLADFLFAIRLAHIYRVCDPDLILHYTIKPVLYGSIAARVLNIPSMATITGLGSVFIQGGWLAWLVGEIYHVSLRFSGAVFFQNSSDYSLFISKRWVRGEIAHLVPGSGVDPDFYAPFSTAHDSVVHQGSFCFLMISRLLWDKGVYEFVEAARRLCDQHLDGPRPYFQLLGQIDAENPSAVPRVLIEEWVSEGIIEYNPQVDDVRPWIVRSDCVVLPSYREGLPRSLVEAASMMKPLIATDVPGCRDVVDDSVNGFLCPARDIEGLLNAMLKMMHLSASQRNEFGYRSREKVIRHFDEKIIVRSYDRVIENVLSLRAGRSS